MSDKVYQIVTDQILAALDRGTVPWHKPWSSKAGTAPKNAVSNKEYRGFNVLVLVSAGFTSPYWMTFKQARALGGSVKKGEHGSHVIYWHILDREVVKSAGTKEIEHVFFLRYYTVFNYEQTENVKLPKGRVVPGAAEADDVATIEAAETIAQKYLDREGLKVKTRDVAAYSPIYDELYMPARNTFETSEGWYSTMFHEIVHSTGHTKRLDRLARTHFGSGEYSREELVAEIGAAMLCGVSGITRQVEIENSAAYIAHWRSFIANDVKAVVSAAGAAQKASDYVVGKAEEKEDDDGDD